MGEAGDQRGAVVLLELVQLRAVDEAGDDLADVVGLARVGGNDAAQFGGRIQRLLRVAQGQRHVLFAVEVADDAPCDGQRVRVILGVMVGYTGDAGVDVGAAQFLGADDLTGGGFD